jgi:Family of unknown function (DUF5677)
MAKSISVKQEKRGRGRPAKGFDPLVGVRMPPESRQAVEAWAEMQPDKPSLSEAIRRLLERALATPKRAKLVNEWMALVAAVRDVALGIFASAEVPITERGAADVKVLALTLLARTVSNVKGAMLLLDARRVVEARIITRSALENLYWTVGLAEQGDAFVGKMRDDEMTHRRAQGQHIFGTEITLEADVGERLRDFLRSSKKQFGKAATLSPKQVAQIRQDFEKTYIFYGQLSADAGHPSLTALNRYVVPKTHPEGEGFDVEPLVSDHELAETCEYLCMAAIGVCVGVNQIVGGLPVAAGLNNIAERYTDLSNRTKVGSG